MSAKETARINIRNPDKKGDYGTVLGTGVRGAGNGNKSRVQRKGVSSVSA